MKRLDVLIAEDNAADAELLVLHLKRDGYDPRAMVVDTPLQFKAALEEQSWDLVISDYSMGAFNAPAAYAILKEQGLDIPFIIVSGTIGEDTAVAAMKAGAHDFLTKGKMTRLGPAIARELREAENRRQRREQERAARLAREHHDMLLDNLHDAVIAVDPGLVVTAWNRAAERVYGWPHEDAVGRRVGDLIPAEGFSFADLARNTGRMGRIQTDGVQLTRTNERIQVESTCIALSNPEGVALGFLFVNRDITARVRAEAERRRAQEQLLQSQKMEAVGHLASGVALEINTPIQFIGDNVHFLDEATRSLLGLLEKTKAEVPAAARDQLRRWEEEAELPYLRDYIPRAVAGTLHSVQRVSTIVRAMKEFANPDQREMIPTDLNRAIQATLELIRGEYEYVADIEADLAELPLVTCHGGDINQVVLNLIVNAAHAIAEVVKGTRRLGRIKVTTRHDGDDVTIEVSDTGAGIPREIRDKIFEPFFTTKEPGRGTGQGLALVRTIVERHCGSVHFETDVGRGTTFVVRLPVGQPAAQPAAQAETESEDALEPALLAATRGDA
jgi:PAS domain S-box-containing protein